MGRTNPTYRDQLRRLEDDWSGYRRALRADARPHFDRLFEQARAHADAAGYQNHRDPTVALLLGVVLEHERRLAEREGRSTPSDRGRSRPTGSVDRPDGDDGGDDVPDEGGGTDDGDDGGDVPDGTGGTDGDDRDGDAGEPPSYRPE
jgi:hypothetical protein